MVPKSIITSIVILFTLITPSLGDEVINIGLICESDNNEEVNEYISIWLKEDGVLERYDRDVWDVDKDGDYTEFFFNGFHSQFMKHSSSDKYITIRYYIDDEIDLRRQTNINRFDLTMTDDLFGKEHPYNCEVFSDKRSFFNGLRNVELKIKNVLKKRKI